MPTDTADLITTPRDRLITTVVVVLIALIVWWMLSRIGRRALGRFGRWRDIPESERAARADTLWMAVRRVALVAIVAAVVLTVMVVWDIPIAPLLGLGSAAIVAVGFGAQTLVKDVIAGFLIVAESQFSIGDVVRVAGVSGSVVDIGLRVTVLRDLDGNVHYVPNGTIEVASNYTQEYAQVVVDVAIAYHEPVDAAMAVIEDELERFAAAPDFAPLLLEAPEVLGVDALADSAVVVRAVVKVDPDERWVVKRELLRRIKNRLDEEGIEIPHPYRTVVLRGTDESAPSGAGGA